jgi:hypothetical protein
MRPRLFCAEFERLSIASESSMSALYEQQSPSRLDVDPDMPLS